MKVLMMLGKVLAGAFWLVFAAALARWLDSPFEQMIYVLGACLLLLHGLQLWLFANLLAARGSLLHERLQVLLFGIFHLYPLRKVSAPAPTSVADQEVAHA
ncbi:conserved hypothetical protein [Pseudomonas sp. 8Z]|uniref:DUF1145 domain-containing protein n=1 Tax=Pseudomonas sp. 8Z TaxID=2653166 RepID=UPI0012F44BAE|nr:DUF1145 domain-containing protein [Pseudomonas sp. 8Z]VXC89506.1 conserved hypothetical protein [Pseudomonas sp. 8Z]